VLAEKLRVGFIGAGSHATKHIYPALQFAPVDLIAVCDLDEERAKSAARQFGALRYYTNYKEMFEKEDIKAVYIVAGYGGEGDVLHATLACEAMEAGLYAWTEKPPANSVEEVLNMRRVEEKTGKFVMVGFKKCFFPTVRKVKEIVQREEFGKIATIYIRYPQSIPESSRRSDPRNMTGVLDHIVHPASVLTYLAGEPESLYIEEEHISGGGGAFIRFKNGALGILHLAAGQSASSPLERLEVVGQGANVVVDNGVKLTYYRRSNPKAYGVARTFIGEDDEAPLFWEPEFSLAQLYNKGLFLEGFAEEVSYFAECVLEGKRPQLCNTEHALQVMRIYEGFMKPSGTPIPL